MTTTRSKWTQTGAFQPPLRYSIRNSTRYRSEVWRAASVGRILSFFWTWFSDFPREGRSPAVRAKRGLMTQRRSTTRKNCCNGVRQFFRGRDRRKEAVPNLPFTSRGTGLLCGNEACPKDESSQWRRPGLAGGPTLRAR